MAVFAQNPPKIRALTQKTDFGLTNSRLGSWNLSIWSVT